MFTYLWLKSQTSIWPSLYDTNLLDWYSFNDSSAKDETDFVTQKSHLLLTTLTIPIWGQGAQKSDYPGISQSTTQNKYKTELKEPPYSISNRELLAIKILIYDVYPLLRTFMHFMHEMKVLVLGWSLLLSCLEKWFEFTIRKQSRYVFRINAQTYWLGWWTGYKSCFPPK